MRKFLNYCKYILFVLFVIALGLSVPCPGEATETNAGSNNLAIETKSLLVKGNNDSLLVGFADSKERKVGREHTKEKKSRSYMPLTDKMESIPVTNINAESLTGAIGKIHNISVTREAYGGSAGLLNCPQGSCCTLMSAMPAARAGLAAAAVNGKIYAIGGLGEAGCLNTVEEYDPETNTWTAKASMLTGRFFLAAAAVNGKIYAMGGCNIAGNILNCVEEYDPVTNTWTTKASMPAGRCFFTAAASNGKIYAIGGSSHVECLSTMDEYNPVTNTWTTKAAMPTARAGLAAAASNGKVYAIGGYSSGYLNTVEEYNPATNTWETKASMSASRYGLAAAAVNGKIYAICGSDDDGNMLNSIEEYDPAANTWLQSANMPIESYFLGAGEYNNRIYAIGGYNSDGGLIEVQEFNTQCNSISNPVLSAGSVTGQPGDVVQVPLTLNSLGEVAGISCELKFNPDLLAFQSATLTGISGFTSDYSYITSYDPGVVTVIFYSSNAVLIPDGMQSLGTLSFSVATGAQPGQACSLELQNAAIGDAWGDDTNPSIESGQFSVP